MKQSVGIIISYFDKQKNQMIKEEYSSLFSCSNYYQISIPTLRKMAKGEKTKKKLFPDDRDFQIQLIEPEISTKTDFSRYHCDLCNVNIRASSKSNHLHSTKHLEKLIEGRKIKGDAWFDEYRRSELRSRRDRIVIEE